MDINKIKKPIYTDDRSDSHLDRPHLIQRAYIPDNYLEQIFSMPINGYHFDYIQGTQKFNAQNFRNALKYVPVVLPVIKNNNEKKKK